MHIDGNTHTAIAAIFSIFLLLMVGYGARKLRILSAKDTGVVNSIVINLALPAFIFASIHDKPLTVGMVKAPFVGFGIQLIILALAYGLARLLKLDRPTTASMMLAATFGNTGYLGLPLVTAAFGGDKASILTAVMMDSFAMRLGLTTVGIAVCTCFAGSRFEWKSLLEFLRTPLFPAVVIGLIFRTTHIPPVLMNTINYMAAATVPLSMISVGLSLSASTIREYPLAYLGAAILKMAALPALMFLALPITGIGDKLAPVVVLEMAMPCAVFTGVIAGRYGANSRFSAGAILAMTLGSIASLPIVLLLVR